MSLPQKAILQSLEVYPLTQTWFFWFFTILKDLPLTSCISQFDYDLYPVVSFWCDVWMAKNYFTFPISFSPILVSPFQWTVIDFAFQLFMKKTFDLFVFLTFLTILLFCLPLLLLSAYPNWSWPNNFTSSAGGVILNSLKMFPPTCYVFRDPW